jgi:hypothetical protein
MKIAFYTLLAAVALFLCSCVTTKERLITKEYQLKIAYMVSLNPVGGVVGAKKKERTKPDKWNHLSDQDFRTTCWLERNGIEFESVEGAWLIHHGLPESGKLKKYYRTTDTSKFTIQSRIIRELKIGSKA